MAEPDDLSDYLRLTLYLPKPAGPGSDQAESQHGRRFRNLDRSPDDESWPITIRHVWVNASPET
jgi:hypothetical protein